MLALEAENAGLCTENAMLKAENRQLGRELRKTEAECQRLEREVVPGSPRRWRQSRLSGGAPSGRLLRIPRAPTLSTRSDRAAGRGRRTVRRLTAGFPTTSTR